MGDGKLEFGNPTDIAYLKSNKSQRDKVLARPEGFSRHSERVPELSDKEFEKLFGDLSPATERDNDVSLQKESGEYPQFVLPPDTIRYNDWYGNPDTEELDRVDKKITVDLLGVKRPQKEKGPAPSWKVQETRVLNGELIKTVYFVGRRGKYFIGENPQK
jgi:hypothetical protein